MLQSHGRDSGDQSSARTQRCRNSANSSRNLGKGQQPAAAKEFPSQCKGLIPPICSPSLCHNRTGQAYKGTKVFRVQTSTSFKSAKVTLILNKQAKHLCVTAAEDLHNVPRAGLKAEGRARDKYLWVLGMAYLQEFWGSIQNASSCLNFCTKSLFISLEATLPIANSSENTNSLTKAVWGFHSNQHCFGETHAE